MSGNLTEIINTITQVVLFGTPVALVLLLFFWNMSMLIFQSGNAEKMKEARARIFWSLIGMFVLFSLAGIIVILQNTIFGTSNQRQGTVNSPSADSPFGGGDTPAFGGADTAGFGGADVGGFGIPGKPDPSNPTNPSNPPSTAPPSQPSRFTDPCVGDTCNI